MSKPEAKGMLAFYIDLNPREELTSEKNYSLTVALVYEDAVFISLINEDQLEKYAEEIKVALQHASGIELTAVVSFSEKDFTLYQQRRMIRWRSDHLSFKQNMDDVEILEDP